MPAFAPARIVKAQLVRGQQARDAHHSGVVILAGRTFTAVELHLGGIEPETDAQNGGVYLVQRGRVVISKLLLPAAPKRDAVITIENIDFLVQNTQGRSGHEPAWIIHFLRTPPKP